jgi:hypothetical protein
MPLLDPAKLEGYRQKRLAHLQLTVISTGKNGFLYKPNFKSECRKSQFNLYKLNNCLFGTQKLILRRFGLDGIHCINLKPIGYS